MIMNLSTLLLKVFFGTLYTIFTILEAAIKSLTPSSWRAKSVKDDIILITGGANGIGRQMALRLARLGATIVIWDIDKKGLSVTAKLINELNGIVFTYECDVTKNNEIYKVAAKTKEEVGIITILINNAGILIGNTMLETPDDKIKRTFDVNILAHFWTVKAFLPDMLKCGKGHIVTIASLAGTVGVYKMIDYCSSKHAVIGFDKGLSMELRTMKADFIKTTVACPYFTRTGMTDRIESSFFPVMNPSYIAEKIVDAILINERVIMIPRYQFLLFILRTMIPWKALVYLDENILEQQNFFQTVPEPFSGNISNK